MVVTIGKTLSLVVAAVYVLIALPFLGWDALKLCFVLLFPLALIWFPEEMGSLSGYLGRSGYVDQESPPVLVSAMGWFFLIGMPVILAIIWR